MLEVGWSELLVIAIVLIVVVGPKDLPRMLRTFATFTRKARGMASEFQSQFNDAMREADLQDLRKSIDDMKGLNPRNAIREALDPLRKAGEDVRSELTKAQADINAKAGQQAATAAVPAPAEPVVSVPAAAVTLPATPPVIAVADEAAPAKSAAKSKPAAMSKPAAKPKTAAKTTVSDKPKTAKPKAKST